jgi:SOS-response transcriptional repressor LexA
MTPQQRTVYNAIESFATEHGYAPTVRDLCKLTARSNAAIHRHLCNLKERGFIKWENRKARSIVLVPVEPAVQHDA